MMKQLQRLLVKQWTLPVLLGFLTLPVFLWGLGSVALYDTEALYAEVPREMLDSGDWIVPQLNSKPHFDKPPLLYWLVALTYRVFGPSEFSTRLWGALGAWGGILLTCFIGKALFDGRTGFLAGIVLATSVGYFIFSRHAMPEPLLSFFLTLAFLAFLLGCQRRRSLFLLMHAALGFAAMTKGLLALALPALVLGSYIVLVQDLTFLKKMKLLPGLLIFLLIVAPWHIAALLRNPGFPWYYFVHEHFLRFLGTRYPRDNYLSATGLIGFTLLWTFPWVAFLPQALWRGLRKSGRSNPEGRAYCFLLLWAGAVVAFFVLSRSRLEYYTLSALPPLALCIGKLWADLTSSNLTVPDFKRAAFSMLSLFIVLVVLAMAVPFIMKGYPELLLKAIASNWPTGAAEASARELLGTIYTPALSTLAGAAATTLLALGLMQRRQIGHAFGTLALMMLPIYAFIHWGFLLGEPFLSSRPVASIVSERMSPEDMIIAEEPWEPMWAAGLAFYTGKTLYFLRKERLPWSAYRTREPKERFLDEAQLSRLWTSIARVYLVISPDGARGLQRIVQPAYTIGVAGGRVVLSNRPS